MVSIHVSAHADLVGPRTATASTSRGPTTGGPDAPQGGRRADEIPGGGGAHRSRGDGGSDTLWGEAGDDAMQGGKGSDELHGGDGNDRLLGAAGDDALSGGTGDDWLWGGRGDDRMTGGSGADVFAFRSARDGADTIADWGDGDDRIDLAELLRSSGRGPADLVLDDATDPGATVLRIAGTTVSITVLGAEADSFDLSAFAETGIIWSRDGQAPVVLDQVPAYDWYHGCGPTAVASVLAYWDLQGCTQLFDAEGWDELRFTWSVQDQISSPEHNAKYDSSPDDADLPAPPDTSIADFLHTSEGSVGYGWTWLSDMERGIEGYASLRGHPLDARSAAFGALDWEDILREIDAGRPMVFLVDSTADGVADHYVPVVGYDDRGTAGRWYGAYTTWSEDETVEWFEFRPTANGDAWGVGYVTFIQESSTDGTVAGDSAGADALLA